MKTLIKLSSHDLTRLLRILEAADGLAVLKTLDGKKGEACLIYPKSNKKAVEDLLNSFADEHILEIKA